MKTEDFKLLYFKAIGIFIIGITSRVVLIFSIELHNLLPNSNVLSIAVFQQPKNFPKNQWLFVWLLVC